MSDEYKYFKIEAAELLTSMTRDLLQLEKQPGDMELVGKLFRESHTLKGAASVVRLNPVSNLAHAMEALLARLRDRQKKIGTEDVTLLLKGVDAIELIMAALKEERPLKSVEIVPVLEQLQGRSSEKIAEEETVSARAIPPESPVELAVPQEKKEGNGEVVTTPDELETIRVLVADMDRINRLANELQICGKRLKNALPRLKKIEKKEKKVDYGTFVKSDERPGRELEKGLAELERHITSSSMLSRELIDIIRTTRLCEVNHMACLFEKAVRDLAMESGRRIVFSIEGRQMRLDRGLLDRVREPVYHLLRNSIIHGIESPEEREGRNKPQEGSLVLRFEKHVGCVRISCFDDGRGLSPEYIREKAVENRLITLEDAGAISDEDSLYLILRSGFTTAGTVTELAGRGVGLDVVKTCVSGLGGSLAIESEKGVSTCFTLTLPLSVDLLQVFAVRAAGRNCLIPLHNTVQIHMIKEGETEWEAGKPVVLYKGVPVPLVSLSDRLGVASDNHMAEKQNALIIKSNIETIALVVDELVGREEVIPRPLAGKLARINHVSAAAIKGNGEPAFILDVASLLEGVKAMPQKSTERKTQPEPPTIMVVDDSLTTRALIQGILTTEGYGVIPASSGEEALKRLKGKNIAIFIIDIEMPGIDGFKLSEMIRQMPDHRDTPIVILSSRGSDADKRRGIEVGANAYLHKGSFEQNEFLTTVERLIE